MVIDLLYTHCRVLIQHIGAVYPTVLLLRSVLLCCLSLVMVLTPDRVILCSSSSSKARISASACSITASSISCNCSSTYSITIRVVAGVAVVTPGALASAVEVAMVA